MKIVKNSFLALLVDEDMTQDHRSTINQLEVFSKLGRDLEKSVRGICRPLDRWTSETTNLFDRDTYLEKENRYIHYKTKLRTLVEKMEIKIYTGRAHEIKQREYDRVDRNIQKLKSQIEVMTAICGEKVIDFCDQ